jgi:putative thiazole-containing bacteriocin maturation protein
MFTIIPTACLKTNQDTYYVPDQEGGIYFRNQKHSFRLQGSNVYQWMEKLIPMFDGSHTMQEITNGLPDTYQRRVYEFATLLLKEGFVRDVSMDKAHTLSANIMKTFQSQIDYLDHHIGSGAAHFEKYRQASLLVIGSGPLLTSLLSSLLESGVQSLSVFLTDKQNTNIERIQYLETEAKKIDIAVKITDITPKDIQPWSKIIQPYDSVLFVGKGTDMEQIIDLGTRCEQENKYFLPAITYDNTGLVGPAQDWESAWRRLEKTTNDIKIETYNTALAILANILSFCWFQLINNVTPIEKQQVFLLDMKTLEGKWHSFLSHPLVRGSKQITKPLDSTTWFAIPLEHKTDIQSIFEHITSPKTGIFRSWGPEDLLQLPLSQCQVEIADPLEKKKLPPIICSALTHIDAQREAMLRGLEAYAIRLLKETSIPHYDEVEVGIGQRHAEAICRGFINYLEIDIKNKPIHPHKAQLEGEQSQFLLECLTLSGAEPSLYLEEHTYGFPIGWIQVNDCWFSSVGLTPSSALLTALHKSLHSLQNQSANHHNFSLCCPYYVHTSFDSSETALQFIINHMKIQNKYIKAFELKLEDIISQHLSVVAVTIEEGEQ